MATLQPLVPVSAADISRGGRFTALPAPLPGQPHPQTPSPKAPHLRPARGLIVDIVVWGSGMPGPSIKGIPEGDNRERTICAECGYILYDNPKIVVGSVTRWGERVLLCRRSINPRRGFWSLPAGYLELNEATSAGAEREAWEEAQARIAIEGLLAIYDIPRISQVQLIYRARLLDESVAPGEESLEVGLFGWDEIPWDEIAFPSVHWALHHEHEAQLMGDYSTRFRPPDDATLPRQPTTGG